MDPAKHPVNEEPEYHTILPPQPAWHGWLARLGTVLWLGVCIWAFYGLHKEWSGFHLADLNAALARIGPGHLALALGLTALSYLCNAGIGILAQRWTGHEIQHPWRDLMISFISSAFTMNAGGTVLGGGSIRMRFAATQGISVPDVGKITLYGGIAGWAGHFLACGLLLALAPPPLDWLRRDLAVIVGCVLVILSVVMIFGSRIWYKKWPAPGLASLTLLMAAVDWVFAGLAMWVLFPGLLPLGVWSFVAIIALSQAVAALTHVPGGMGVLELTITKALGGAVASPVLAGALVTYRLIYYVVPFFTAIVLLGSRELLRRKAALMKGGVMVGRGWGIVAPRLASLLTLGGGFMLLLSSNSPIEQARRGLLESLLPLPFVEGSHFVSSITGALLILLAHGLQRRVQTAWWISVALMAGGIVFSLTKGFDWEEALVLAFILICLLPCRGYFHRHAALWTYRFTAGWWLMILALMAVTVWLGFFTTRHVPYQHELWWRFTFDSDASRFMRAAVGSGCVFAIIGLAQALRPSKSRKVTPVEPVVVENLVRHSSYADASLAFLDDKEFTVSADGRCGLMHADQGRSRIVMGDPLGETDLADDLLWKFVEQARGEGMRPVFYQMSVAEMPRLVDMGFKLFKLGEEAHVALDSFSLEGSQMRKLRQARNRFQNSGLVFSIWDQATVAERIETLRAISDDWLAGHRVGEKGFSLGRFDDDYIQRFPCGVVHNAKGEAIAFTNILATGNKTELSVDLMRHLSDAPNGVMEAMFIELMLWGREQGYGQFNLGMAPLSGLSTHPLAPLWNRVAAGFFHRGESFYNFQGLRSYKDKFNPEWEPLYIAVQSNWSLPSALLDATALIGGGIRNTLSKNKSSTEATRAKGDQQ
jgi:phosphatidylglycerol lysyltransferase